MLYFPVYKCKYAVLFDLWAMLIPYSVENPKYKVWTIFSRKIDILVILRAQDWCESGAFPQLHFRKNDIHSKFSVVGDMNKAHFFHPEHFLLECPRHDFSIEHITYPSLISITDEQTFVRCNFSFSRSTNTRQDGIKRSRMEEMRKTD